MTLTLAQVRTWRPQVLAGVADALSVRRRQLLVAVEDLDLEAAPPSSWTGAAAGAATARHDELRESLAEVTGEVAAVISALDAASAAAQAVCDDLDGVLSFAAGNGCRVDLHTGTVHASDDGADPQVIADRLTGVLSAAVTTDAELTRALHYATAVLGQAGPGAEEPEVTRLPAGATEVEVARWWNELDPAAQQHVLDHHPEWVGNLDGIPAWARDEANRTL